jgi:hypothetical protein
MDDTYCLFVTVSCMLTLVLPTAAQPLFALMTFGLAVAALTCTEPTRPTSPAQSRRGGVPGS